MFNEKNEKTVNLLKNIEKLYLWIYIYNFIFIIL
jgi:hypothetical protein